MKTKLIKITLLLIFIQLAAFAQNTTVKYNL